MARSINRRVAQQIVETVRDVCNHNINFIDPKGIIFASTDASRVGDFHEIGRQVARTGQMVEVEKNDSFLGTQKGVNIPFVYQGEIVAVIGISGEPKKVRQYAYLAQKITALILREQELEDQSNNRKQQMNYIVRSLISGEHIHPDYLTDFLGMYQANRKMEYRTVVVQVNGQIQSANLSFLEREIFQAFQKTESPFYTFQYPNEYVLFVEAERWERCRPLLQKLTDQYGELLRVGVGICRRLTKQNQSYQSACIALNSRVHTNGMVMFDELDLEILMGCIPTEVQVKFLKKTIQCLDEKEKKLLQVYFESNLSLKTTCEKLYIHKNTVQYQLDKIGKDCGYNPRQFRDAVVLYLALQLE